MSQKEQVLEMIDEEIRKLKFATERFDRFGNRYDINAVDKHTKNLVRLGVLVDLKIAVKYGIN